MGGVVVVVRMDTNSKTLQWSKVTGRGGRSKYVLHEIGVHSLWR